MFVVEISTSNGATAKAITEKGTPREAEMLFHQIMASMMANDKVTHGVCTVLDNNGRQIFELTREFWNPKSEQSSIVPE